MNNLQRRDFLKIIGITTTTLAFSCANVFKKKKTLPNIVYILADDMGYGDVSYLNPDGKIPTPNIDKLGADGIVFTDAHSGSAVCTPTRYGILTGRYCWRSRLKSGVLEGYSKSLIEKGRLTVASMLKKYGYSSACIGKWHLGWDWQTTDGKDAIKFGKQAGMNVDYSKPILNGPIDVGFNYFWGIPASLDMVPYVYIENDYVVDAPTETTYDKSDKEFLRDGPVAPGFKVEDVLPICTQKAVDFIDNHVKTKLDEPFFMYFPLTAPHTPIVPAKKFQGKTGLGAYGDFVYQCDWTVGQIMQTIKKHGIIDNTIFIFTSDNGCAPGADFEHLGQLGHDPSYIFRGYKADIYEGGHRIPFIVRWPEKIKPGSKSDQVICLTDLLATIADIVDKKLPDNAGEDSVSFLPDLLGAANKSLREATVHHSANGSFSIRKGKWKLELCPGSGGWSHPIPEKAMMLGLSMLQLYDLSKDVKEQENLYMRYPDVVHDLLTVLDKYVHTGRSTPGTPQKNDGNPDIWKPMQMRQQNYNIIKVDHLAVNKSIKSINNAIVKYGADKGLALLVDGIQASSYYNDGYWLGVEKDDLEFVVDLKKVCDLQKVSITALCDQGMWIFHPLSVEISLSENGKDFFNKKKIENTEITNSDLKNVKDFSHNFVKTKARFIKLKVENIGICPEWHKGAGGKAWIFMDEVVVE